MADNHFDLVLVWDNLGGSVRVDSGGQATVTDPPTGNPLPVVQNGQTVTTVTADRNGRVSFVAQQGQVKLTSGGLSSTYTSAEASASGAANAAAAQTAQAAAESARDQAINATSSKVDKDSLVINVKDYGATGDGTTDDTTAIQNAVTKAKSVARVLYFPKGTYLFSSTITGYGLIAGDGRGITTLKYTGTSTAIQLAATVGTRSYNGRLEGFTLTVPSGSTATVGIDMESHSNAYITNVAVSGFTTTGFWLRSTVVSGGCVYNTFVNVEATVCGTGFLIDGIQSNENRFFGCRTNLNTTFGWHITGGNHNQIIGCSTESGNTGVLIEGGAASGRNQIAFTRFESNSGNSVWVGPSVDKTVLLCNDLISTGGTLVDNGDRTMVLGSTAAAAEFTRIKGMGSDLTPLFAARDTYSASGTPTTVEIENARFGGKFVRGIRNSSTELWYVSGEGAIKARDTTTAGRTSAASAGLGAMMYDSTLKKPIWSDGTVWRDSAGTAV